MVTTTAVRPSPNRRSDLPSISGGLPHSEIVGSKGIRTSPTLIAAYHVLHRLCMPRHPPIALKTLDHSHCQCPSFLPGGQFPSGKSCNLPGVSAANDAPGRKDQLLEICPMAAVRQANHMPGIERPMATDHTGCPGGTRTNLLFTMSCRTGERPKPSANLVCERLPPTMEWWSRTGSNRRHPACKAGALPAELRPRYSSLKRRRPHPWPWLARHRARRPVGLADAFRIRGARPAKLDAIQNGGPGRT